MLVGTLNNILSLYWKVKLSFLCRVGFFVGISHATKKIPVIKNPRDIPKVNNPQKIESGGQKSRDSKKSRIPEIKIPRLKKSRIPGIFWKSQKNPDGQKIVKTQNFKSFRSFESFRPFGIFGIFHSGFFEIFKSRSRSPGFWDCRDFSI